MTTPSVNDLFGFTCRKRCLWQFFSRSWDRKENIEGYLGKLTELLLGEPLTLTTPDGTALSRRCQDPGRRF
jgi:hypothetical protein